MYRKILVPLDGSLRAEAILPHVRELAVRYESSLVLLRVFEIPVAGIATSAPEEEFDAMPYISREQMLASVEEARDYLQSVCRRMTDSCTSATQKIAFGPVAATIIRTAEEEDVDLIAMASHGSSGISGVYYGSVAAGVLQRVDRALLIVRAYEAGN